MSKQLNAQPTTSRQAGNNADFVAVESGEERQDTYEILDAQDTYEPNDDAARTVTPVPVGGANASTIANPTNAAHELATAEQPQANGNAEGARAARDGMVTNEESIGDDPNVIGSGALWGSIEKTVGSSMIRSVSKLVEEERPGLNDFMENDYADGAIGLQRRTVETLSKVIDQQSKIAKMLHKKQLEDALTECGKYIDSDSLYIRKDMKMLHHTYVNRLEELDEIYDRQGKKAKEYLANKVLAEIALPTPNDVVGMRDIKFAMGGSVVTLVIVAIMSGWWWQ